MNEQDMKILISEQQKQIRDLKTWLHVAQGHTPDMYSCRKCGHPVVSGYCCTWCGDGSLTLTKEEINNE